MKQRLSILGSTGSIGTQTLELVRLSSELSVAALSARSNIKLLMEQILEFRPGLVCLYEEDKAEALRQQLKERAEDQETPEELRAYLRDLPVLRGMEGLMKAAACPEADTTVVAVVGMIGIRPTIAAIEARKKIALANKETLVCAGHIIMSMVREYGVTLTPVDSEHSAIFQCLQGEEKGSVEKILLTASGGPFRGYRLEQLRDIRPKDALKHPNWSMGAKITIDSSTMINKALEVMEAHWLFDVPMEDIEVVIQPQSVIHSMVQFRDGAVKAQLGVPSMLIPIEYALFAPERIPLPPEEKLDFRSLAKLDFSIPDPEVFRGLALGIRAGKRGGTMPTVFNAANEEAVAAFLQERIAYLDIPAGIEAAMEAHEVKEDPSLEEILETEAWARAFIRDRFGLSEETKAKKLEDTTC